MAPRRNPDIVVAVLWENGDWGANSAKLAAQVIDAFVEKQRQREGNLRLVAESPTHPPKPQQNRPQQRPRPLINEASSPHHKPKTQAKRDRH